MNFIVTFTDRTTAIYDAGSASTVASVMASASAATGTGGATFASFDSPVINASEHNAFRAMLAIGPGVTAANDEGIWAVDGTGVLQLVARTGTSTAPGTTSTFTALSDPVYTDSNSLAFVGTLKVGTGLATKTTDTGVWSNVSGNLAPFAMEGGQAPGCPAGATFAAFSQIVLPNHRGAIFLATLNANAAAGVTRSTDVGIWATDSSGQLQLIVRTGDILNGKTVTALSFAPGSCQSRNFAPSTGDLVYIATFSDKSSGIFGVDLP